MSLSFPAGVSIIVSDRSHAQLNWLPIFIVNEFLVSLFQLF
jgi:hypothetical protein